VERTGPSTLKAARDFTEIALAFAQGKRDIVAERAALFCQKEENQTFGERRRRAQQILTLVSQNEDTAWDGIRALLLR
jgi:hypothetical protein